MNLLRYTLLAAALLVTLPAAAQTAYTRTANGNWTDASGWSPTGIPGSSDTADLNGRTVTLDADVTVGVLLLRSGTLNGASDLVVTDTLRWEAGTSEATGTLTVGPDATLRLRGDDFRMGSGGVLLNQGQAMWEAPAEWGGPGQFINEGELILAFDAATPARLCFSSVVDAVINGPTGLIRRTGTGEVTIYCGFSNAGTVRVENGSIALRGFNATGGTDTGAYEVEAAGMLVFDGGGVRTMTAEASVTGEGTVGVHGGTTTLGGPYDVRTTRFINVNGSGVFNFDGDATTDTLEITTGTLGGSGTLTVTDVFTWTGGVMRGSGTTIVPEDATLSISDGATKAFYDTRTLRNEGTGTWNGSEGFSNHNGTLFLNAGALEVSAGTTDAFGTFFAGTFTNTGTMTLDSGTVTRFGSFFHNEGVVEIISGELVLSGFNANGGTDTGRYVLADSTRLEFTGGRRTLTETASIVGTGTVVINDGSDWQEVMNGATWRPGASPGTLTIESDYPAEEGVIEIELAGYAPGTEHDHVVVTGEAELSGTLRIALLDDFVPQEGDRFTVLTATAVTGTFAALELPGGVEASVETTDTTAVLVIGQVTVANEDEADETLPATFALHAPYPNPTAGHAMLAFDLPEPMHVRLTVYDLLGREVAVLVDAERSAGRHEAVLDAAGLASGVYVTRIQASAFVQTQRVTLLR